MLLYDGMRSLDYSVIAEIWETDRSQHGVPRFDFMRCASLRGAVTADHGVGIRPTHGPAEAARADLVVVPGAARPRETIPPVLLTALRRAHADGGTVAGLHTGAFVLAQAGLLNGRRATTDRAFARLLRDVCPQARVEPDTPYIVDDGVCTSAESVAGIDLCLHLVGEAHGTDVAEAIAGLMTPRQDRPGHRRRLTLEPVTPRTPDDLVAETIAWARAHLAERINVRELAARAHVSERTFARRFADIMGTTPLYWMNRERVRLAQRLLEDPRLPISLVAQRSGFGTPQALRRHFKEFTGLTPTAYRSAPVHRVRNVG